MGEGVKVGIQAAVEAVGLGEPPVERAEQLALLTPPVAEGVEANAPAVKRGPGRPPGSRNRRTEQWVQYLHERYSSPVEALAIEAERTVLDVVEALGLVEPTNEQLLSIWREQNRLRVELAPYMHQKLPQLAELKLDAGGDQRSDAEILARIHELARRAGVPLGPVVDVTPQGDQGTQSNQQVTDDDAR